MTDANLSLATAERIDAACDRFEADWQAGRRPRIEDHLAAAAPADREPLLAALLAIEVELRRAAGDAPTLDELLRRFPGSDATCRAALRSGAGDTSVEAVNTAPAEPPGPPAAVPQRIGRFEVRGVLGAGAFGRVYRANDPQLGRDVALKVPLAGSLQTPAERDRFLREARAAATVSHPNVCAVHEVGEHDGTPYIVMAYVAGRSLAELLQGRPEPLPQRQAAKVVRKIAAGLAAAHKRGVVHRDLKPANVLFDHEGRDVVVTDFGLARAPRLGEADATRSGVVLGTPAYMSPEQARGDAKSVGPAGDVFSLGVILYELLTGRRPFAGSTMEVLWSIVHADPEPPSRHRPGLDPRLEAACRKAMAKAPAARFASMKEFAAAIDEYLRAPAPPMTDTTEGSGTEVVATPPPPPSPRQEKSRPAPRQPGRRLLTLAAFLAAGGLVALGGVLFFTRTKSTTVLVSVDVDLTDRTLTFSLDEKPVTPEALAKPIELTVGSHTLVVKRGKEELRRVTFKVSKDAGERIEILDDTAKRAAVKLPRKEETSTKQPPKPPLADGWIPLFNGRDLVGWEVDGDPKGWAVEDGAIVTQPADKLRGWLFTRQEFEDFELRFEFALSSRASSGVAVRGTPGEGGGNKLQLEVQLRDDPGFPNKQVTGSIIPTGIDWFAPPAPPALKPLGEWNEMRITARGPVLTIEVNGRKAHEVDLAKIDPASLKGDKEWGPRNLKRSRGRIGLQYSAAKVKFRDLRVRALPKQAAPQPGKATPADPDRAAARWFLGVGGAMEIEVDGQKVGLMKASDLPDVPFRITRFWCDPDRPLTDKGMLENLKGLLEVGYFDTGAKINGTGFACFHHNRRRIGFELYGVPLTDEGLRAIGGVPKLDSLFTDSSFLTDAGLAHLAGHPEMDRLGLHGHKITDAGFAHLKGLTNVADLGLGGTQVGDASLPLLTGWGRLNRVGLQRTKVTDAGMKHLTKPAALRGVILEHTAVGDAGLEHLKKANLTHLWLSHSKVTRAGVAKLHEFKQLYDVSLQGLSLKDADMPAVAACAGLNYLDLSDNPITDAGLKSLHGMKSLQILRLRNCPRLTPAGVAALEKALPRCKVER